MNAGAARTAAPRPLTRLAEAHAVVVIDDLTTKNMTRAAAGNRRDMGCWHTDSALGLTIHVSLARDETRPDNGGSMRSLAVAGF
ncbi:MAG: hypothetical protein ACSLE6_07915 [Mycobacterium sp.]